MDQALSKEVSKICIKYPSCIGCPFSRYRCDLEKIDIATIIRIIKTNAAKERR